MKLHTVSWKKMIKSVFKFPKKIVNVLKFCSEDFSTNRTAMVSHHIIFNSGRTFQRTVIIRVLSRMGLEENYRRVSEEEIIWLEEAHLDLNICFLGYSERTTHRTANFKSTIFIHVVLEDDGLNIILNDFPVQPI